MRKIRLELKINWKINVFDNLGCVLIRSRFAWVPVFSKILKKIKSDEKENILFNLHKRMVDLK